MAGRRFRRVLAAWCGWSALWAAGCAEPELETYYGRRQMPLSSASVNGTDVLGGMFAAAGHDVTARRALIGSEMESADTIVWFPDDFQPPKAEVCEWFDEWLAARAGRTLIYVGREFDAAPLYWRKMALRVPAEQRGEYRARQAAAAARALARPFGGKGEPDCDWFSVEEEKPRDVRTLSGPWSKSIAAGDTEIELASRFALRRPADSLLAFGDDVLVAKMPVGPEKESRLLLVTNGSFLLNLPLVNHEHRKLAVRLIEAAGPPGRVVFLESGPGGPPIDPPATDNSLWRMFGAWPLNVILLHWAALGVIFCFARWPIFGRPRMPPAEPVSDFGKHVDAVGELLCRSKDRAFALALLRPADDAQGAGRGTRAAAELDQPGSQGQSASTQTGSRR